MSTASLNSIIYKKDGTPLIISGPCSAETEAQVIGTAIGLKEIGGVDILRAGIWKPRTRPGSFEGVGAVGLPWLQEAKKITGLPIAIEVANAKQVELANKFGIDILWIGARTTANPFSVQEIADALKGVNIPVFIKNPTNPDVELWMGALERLTNAGLKQLGLIHRGFSTYKVGKFRNEPIWQLAMEMKNRNPDLLMINDPSHISGSRDLLFEVVQNAIELSYDGFMIESHIDPVNAWSDANQQITPKVLAEIVSKIRRSGNKESSGEYPKEKFL